MRTRRKAGRPCAIKNEHGKMINALQALRETAAAPEGEKLRKKFDQEIEKYQ
jgi:hypothetical protein